MAEVSPFLSTKRYAVVTGANKGIGLGICKQLTSNGVMVILTARDEFKGLEAVKKLKDSNSEFSDLIIFHQLDVTDPNSIASLADFVNTRFRKLDILVNNAGHGGIEVDPDGFRSAAESGKSFEEINWTEISTQPPELLEECINTNYYGPKAVTEAFIPLLQLSDSARIVNVSSSVGKLKNLKHEGAKGVFNDADNLTEEKIDEVLNEFLRHLKDDGLAEKGWPEFLYAYITSKAALNAYTRVMAKRFPSICINSVCPGFVKTDINFNNGKLSVEEGAESPVRLALLPNGGISGPFFVRQEVFHFNQVPRIYNHLSQDLIGEAICLS